MLTPDATASSAVAISAFRRTRRFGDLLRCFNTIPLPDALMSASVARKIVRRHLINSEVMRLFRRNLARRTRELSHAR
jgi:hypothetical protein